MPDGHRRRSRGDSLLSRHLWWCTVPYGLANDSLTSGQGSLSDASSTVLSACGADTLTSIAIAGSRPPVSAGASDNKQDVRWMMEDV